MAGTVAGIALAARARRVGAPRRIPPLVGRGGRPSRGPRRARAGSAVVALAWVALAQSAEAAAAWLEHPDVGRAHPAASVAVLAAVPGLLVGGNAWAWGATPRGSPLRWAIVAALVLLAAVALLLLVGACGSEV